MTIPFNKPPYLESSESIVLSALRDGKLSGGGPFSQMSKEWLMKKNPDIDQVLLTTSCTHALEISAVLLNLTDGDEVIVPSYTFVTSALAFVMHGARIRFCDIRKDTLNIDEALLESAITKKTKAIVVVHYAGVACEMDAIMAIAKKHNLAVIEDNAHGLFGKYKGVNLGSIGDFSSHSFHETKNISCGEGGALFVKDPELSQRAHIILEKGTNRQQFLNGQVDKYSWVDKGSSYVLSDLLAALLYSQLSHSNHIQSKRELMWNTYFKNLEGWASGQGITLPFVPAHCEQTYHMFYLMMPDQLSRDELIASLGKKNISTAFHYVPLHSSKMGLEIALKDQDNCPISSNVSNRIIRLPLFYNLENADQAKVIDAVTALIL